MNLSHRMDRKHEQAANKAAASRPADLPDLPKGADEWFAEQMLKPGAKVKQTTLRGKHPKAGKRTLTAAKALKFISDADGPVTALQVADAVGVTPEAMRHSLNKMHDLKILKKSGKPNKLKWSKVKCQ